MSALELARKHRPDRFAEIAGQRPATAVLYRMALRGTLPLVLLLYGERGCGKTSMARILAKALNCAAGPGKAGEWPCGTCASCVAVTRGASPDVEEIDAASNGSVDDIEEMCRRASYGTAGEFHVFIIDEAHGISREGFDRLLKMFEEPPANTIFILITTRFDAIPKTVRDRSRAGEFWFPPLAPAVILARLTAVCEAEGIKAEPELLSAIAEKARGSLRDALMALEQMAAVDISSLKMWRELTGEYDIAPGLLSAAADGDYPALFYSLSAALASAGDPGRVTALLIRCLSDVLVLTVPGGKITEQGEALKARRELAARLGAARTLSVMQVLWELKAKVQSGDREADLILAVAMISRRLCPPAPDQAPIAPESSGRERMAQLRSVLGAEP